MSRKIWRYTMTATEMKFWESEDMQGWREALQACVEDDARDEGCKKFIIFDKNENLITKGDVRKLAEPEPVEI